MTNFTPATAVLLFLDSPFKKADHSASLQKSSVTGTYLLKALSGQDEDVSYPVVSHQTNRTL